MKPTPIEERLSQDIANLVWQLTHAKVELEAAATQQRALISQRDALLSEIAELKKRAAEVEPMAHASNGHGANPYAVPNA